MRHKYVTRGIVLRHALVGEESAFVTVLTEELGLVRAKAQGVRKPAAKLAPALTTLSESTLTLMRGREGWRLSGAIQEESHARALPPLSRERAGRIALLMLRLMSGEGGGEELYALYAAYLEALARLPEEAQEEAEVLAALHLLGALGLDAGVTVPGERFSEEALTYARENRLELIARVNRGLTASGL